MVIVRTVPPTPNPLEAVSVEAASVKSPKGDARPYVQLAITIAVGEPKVDGNKCSSTIRTHDLRCLFAQLGQGRDCTTVPLWKLAQDALSLTFGGLSANRRLKLVVNNAGPKEG